MIVALGAAQLVMAVLLVVALATMPGDEWSPAAPDWFFESPRQAWLVLAPLMACSGVASVVVGTWASVKSERSG